MKIESSEDRLMMFKLAPEVRPYVGWNLASCYKHGKRWLGTRSVRKIESGVYLVDLLAKVLETPCSWRQRDLMTLLAALAQRVERLEREGRNPLTRLTHRHWLTRGSFPDYLSLLKVAQAYGLDSVSGLLREVLSGPEPQTKRPRRRAGVRHAQAA